MSDVRVFATFQISRRLAASYLASWLLRLAYIAVLMRPQSSAHLTWQMKCPKLRVECHNGGRCLALRDCPAQTGARIPPRRPARASGCPRFLFEFIHSCSSGCYQWPFRNRTGMQDKECKTNRPLCFGLLVLFSKAQRQDFQSLPFLRVSMLSQCRDHQVYERLLFPFPCLKSGKRPLHRKSAYSDDRGHSVSGARTVLVPTEGLVALGRCNYESGAWKMHTDLADRRIAASDDDLMDTRGDQFADDRVASGIVRSHADDLARLPADGIFRVSGCFGD